MNTATSLTGVIRQLQVKPTDAQPDGELLARYIHQLSEHESGPFTSINCKPVKVSGEEIDVWLLVNTKLG